MSSIPRQTPDEDDSDAWAELAEHRDTLEMCIEEDTAFAPYAENLLDELDNRGYGQ